VATDCSDRDKEHPQNVLPACPHENVPTSVYITVGNPRELHLEEGSSGWERPLATMWNGVSCSCHHVLDGGIIKQVLRCLLSFVPGSDNGEPC
jgi:hypothetical protein